MISPLISTLRRRIAPAALMLVFFQPGLTVTDNSAKVNFPSSIDFHLEAASDTPIESAEIEVSTGALSCGSGATRAAPDQFTGGKSITADWTWELRQTGALPPGTVVTWVWNAHTADGKTFSTPEEKVTVDDTGHTWQKRETPELLLQWYSGDQKFASAIQQSAEAGIKNLNDTLGVSDDGQIHVYLYANPDDMKGATLYAPGWSGGLAFAPENTLLLAVAPSELDWGLRAIKHELTHIIVDRHTFSCVNSTPTWFEEGLAMYFEGPADPGYTSLLQDAVKSDTLLSVRELGSGISGDSTLASLSYAESAGLVRFLVETYGNDKILLLLDQWKQGTSQDKALTAVYGFDRDGLEVAWRESLGAQPMKAAPVASNAEPTAYPTFLPLDGAPLAATEVRPTPDYLNPAAGADTASGSSSTGTTGSDNGPWIIVAVVICGVLVLLAIIVGVVVWLVRSSNKTPPAEMS